MISARFDVLNRFIVTTMLDRRDNSVSQFLTAQAFEGYVLYSWRLMAPLGRFELPTGRFVRPAPLVR